MAFILSQCYQPRKYQYFPWLLVSFLHSAFNFIDVTDHLEFHSTPVNVSTHDQKIFCSLRTRDSFAVALCLYCGGIEELRGSPYTGTAFVMDCVKASAA